MKKTFRIDFQIKTIETHTTFVEAETRQEAVVKWSAGVLDTNGKPRKVKRIAGSKKVTELRTNRKSPK